MRAWEYLIVALPTFREARPVQGESASVAVLNQLGAGGWEAVGMSTLQDGSVAVLLKRPALADAEQDEPSRGDLGRNWP